MRGMSAIRRPGEKLAPSTRRAVTNFADRFYRKVYPPDPKDAARPLDFSDPDSFATTCARRGSWLMTASRTEPALT
jgi:hypothetical protein